MPTWGWRSTAAAFFGCGDELRLPWLSDKMKTRSSENAGVSLLVYRTKTIVMQTDLQLLICLRKGCNPRSSSCMKQNKNAFTSRTSLQSVSGNTDVIVEAHLYFKLEKAAFWREIYQLITVVGLFDRFLSTLRFNQSADIAIIEKTFQI